MIIKKYLLVALFHASLVLGGMAQVINTAVSNQSVCPGTLVVPVVVSNCNGVSGISLALAFNTQILTWQSYQNAHPALASGFLLVNQAGGKVFISWASLTPANIGNDTLVKLVFASSPGSSALSWDTQTSGNCEYSNFLGLVLPSTYTNSTITVYAPPAVVNHPVNATVIIGQSVSFSVSGSGTGLSYQWQVSTDGGEIFNNLSNGNGYSGATTTTLSYSSTTLAMNGYRYRCRISGTCPEPVFSNPALLTVNPPPQVIAVAVGSINQCPANYVVPVYVTNCTNVGAISLALSYNSQLLTFTGSQNLHPGLAGGLTAISSAGNKIYLTWAGEAATSLLTGQALLVELLFTATTGGTGTFTWDTQTPGQCEFVNFSGGIIQSTYTNGTCSITYPPVITSQPVSVTVNSGQNTSFSVSATGSGLGYQWQRSINGGTTWANLSNGVPFSGATSATLNISATPYSLNGQQFKCVVSGSCTPSQVSNPVTLTVIPPPQVIAVQAGSFTGCAGQLIIPVTASNVSAVGAFSLGLTFNSSLVQFANIQNVNQTLAGGLIVANANSGHVYVSWASDSPVTIPASPAVLYEMVFNGNLGGTGTFSWDTSIPGSCEFVDGSGTLILSTYSGGSLNLLQPPALTSQPLNLSLQEGQSGNFSVSATGASISYQWQRSTDGGLTWSNIGANSASLNTGVVSLGMNGYQYHCVVSGSCPPQAISNPAVLTVFPATQVIVFDLPAISNLCTQTIEVPLYVSNFYGVGSFSLAVEYNPALLTFTGVSGISPGLSSGLLVSNGLPGKLFVSWASTLACNTSGNITLLKFNFLSYGGTTALSFDVSTPGNCEVTDVNGLPIAAGYSNGSIAVSPQPLSVSAGADLIMVEGIPQAINASVSGGTAPYLYSWTPPDSLSGSGVLQPVANPTQSTLYTLSVTDAIGCVGTDQVWVIVESVPETGWLWAQGLGSGGEDAAMDVCADSEGNGLATGSFGSTSISFGNTTLTNLANSSLFVTKYSPDGNPLWAVQSENEGWTEGKAISRDASGNVYVAGFFQGSEVEIQGQTAMGHGWADAFVARFSPTGTLDWVRSFGGSSQDKATDLVVDGDGNVIVTGFFLSGNVSFGSTNLTNSTTNFADIFITKLDPSGNVVWAKKVGGSEWDEAWGLAISPAGALYLTGYFVSSTLQFPGTSLSHNGTGTPNGFVARFNSSGDFSWAMKPSLSTNNYGVALACDSAGQIYWSGYFFDTQLQLGSTVLANGGGSDLFLSRISPSGTPQWTRKPSGSGFDMPTSVALRSSNEIILSGYFNSPTLQFGALPANGNGFYDMFIAHYDSVGNEMLAQAIGAGGEDLILGSGADAFGNIYFAGSYKSQAISFGPFPLTNPAPGEANLFVAKYGATDPQLSISGQVNQPVCHGSGNGSIQVVVSQGMPPFNYLWTNGSTQAGLSGLAAGSYGVTVTDANGHTAYFAAQISDPAVLVVNGTTGEASCNTCSDGTIDLAVTGGVPPYQYLWPTGQTAASIGSLLPGTYAASVTDLNGCQATGSFVVGVSEQTQTIALLTGWNLFSTYINTTGMNIASVLLPIYSKIQIVKNGSGAVYWPQFNINGIGAMVVGQGYQIKLNSAGSLPITGQAVVPQNWPLNLPAGWSFLGYLRQNASPLVTNLAGIQSHILIIKNSGGQVYWPQFNINSIGNLVPGQGYQIRLNSPATLTYPPN